MSSFFVPRCNASLHEVKSWRKEQGWMYKRSKAEERFASALSEQARSEFCLSLTEADVIASQHNHNADHSIVTMQSQHNHSRIIMQPQRKPSSRPFIIIPVTNVQASKEFHQIIYYCLSKIYFPKVFHSVLERFWMQNLRIQTIWYQNY